jgi:hypothetical protein
MPKQEIGVCTDRLAAGNCSPLNECNDIGNPQTKMDVRS